MPPETESSSVSGTTSADAGVGAHSTVSRAERDAMQDRSTTRHDQIVDTGADEAHTAGVLNQTRAWNANDKRCFDEFLHESLSDVRRYRSVSDKLDDVIVQSMQNAVETANMVSKQAIRAAENAAESANRVGKQTLRHSDIAMDRQWNLDEVSKIAANSTNIDTATLTVLVAKLATELASRQTPAA